jgi:aminoglycoside phosphotransferase family enzyme/predicted kinase
MSALPELVQAMLIPEAYPESPEKIELMQTQMSFIFLTGDYVYKVKKPVNLGYLDYTTLEKRLFFCRKEVELNSRLCPETYLGVLPITKDKGRIFIGGEGNIIEYVVKMCYLPQQKMMNVLLEQNRVTAEMVEKVAQKLADFHRLAETNGEISTYGSIKAIMVNTEENFSQTEKYIGKTISNEKYDRIKNYTNRFIKENEVLFNERVTGGRIRDCHGDLHAAHICFTDGVCIYDCIEFNDRFRYCDVASEVAFLAMDLDHYGRADISRSFINTYIASSRDREIIKLLKFYKCYRAYVRGKVESFKTDDPYISEAEREKARTAATGYFELADSYTRKKPLLIITVGLVGTGKSTVARALAKRLGLTVISSDITRKKIAGVPPTEHHFEGFSGGIYTPEFTRQTYDAMFAEAKGIMASGDSVVLDASFIRKEERLRAKQLAEDAKSDFLIVETVLPEDVVKKRLARRLKSGSVSDGRWEIFLPQKERFEPVNEVAEEQHIIADTSSPIDGLIRGLLSTLELRFL